MRTLVARAPARVDFGGGWTDVPPYGEEMGGFVCNLAIDRRALLVSALAYVLWALADLFERFGAVEPIAESTSAP